LDDEKLPLSQSDVEGFFQSVHFVPHLPGRAASPVEQSLRPDHALSIPRNEIALWSLQPQRFCELLQLLQAVV
jgi:hypothetical protein